jgi:hypothetical protein
MEENVENIQAGREEKKSQSSEGEMGREREREREEGRLRIQRDPHPLADCISLHFGVMHCLCGKMVHGNLGYIQVGLLVTGTKSGQLPVSLGSISKDPTNYGMKYF